MAKQTINIGSAANDGTGSTLRAAFDITNDNFTELYDGSGGLLHKIEGTNFTGSLLVGHSTTGTLSSAENNTALGIGSLDALTTGDNNVAIGYNAGTSINSGETNVVIGAYAGDAVTTGDRNVAIGYQALSAEDTGHRNVAIGYNALQVQNYGDNNYNVAVGYSAGSSVTSGLQNTIIGALAGDALTEGQYNTAIGYESLSGEDTGDRNTAVGWRALKDLNYDGHGYNAAFGMSAGENISTGIQNTLIGSLAADSLTTGSNNTIIGYNAAASAVDVSNEVTIGNSSIANVRIPADSTLKIGASGDLQLEHLSSNSFIKNTAVGDLYIENQVDDASIIFRSDDGSGGLATYFFLDGQNTRTEFLKDVKFPDNVKANFGTSVDLQIYHNGTNSLIENATGHIYIKNSADDSDVIFECDNGSGGLVEYFRVDGGTERIESSKSFRFADSARVQLGASSDMQIYHTGTNSIIENTTGVLKIQSSLTDGDISFIADDGSGGTTEYFRVDGSSENVLFSKLIKISDNVELRLGDGNDIKIYHDTSNSYIKTGTEAGNLIIEQNTDDADIIFKNDDGSGGVTTYFFLDGSSVTTQFYKTLKLYDAAELYIGDDNDLRLYHNGSNSYIENYTSDLIISNTADDADVRFFCDDGSGGVTEYFRLDGSLGYTVASKNILLDDNVKLRVGSSADLEIYHDGSNSYIDDASGTGSLYVNTNAFRLVSANKGENMIRAFEDGQVILCHNNIDRLTTTSTGVSVTGDINLGDSSYLYIGASNDLQLIHDGTDSYVSNTQNEGDLIIQNNGNDKDILFKCDDGSGGITEYFRLDGSTEQNVVSKNMRFEDSVQAQFGAGTDLRIYHDGSDSFISDTGTGDLYVKASNNFFVESSAGASKIIARTGGAVDLYHNGSKKIETTSTGTKTTGQMDIAALNSAPSSASDTGTVGEIRFTADYIYVCVASNTWKRAALSTW